MSIRKCTKESGKWESGQKGEGKRQRTMLASMNAYSNSALPARSCSLRNEAFSTSVYMATWSASSGGVCARWIVSTIASTS